MQKAPAALSAPPTISFDASITAADGTRTVTQRIPDIPAYVQYSWDNGSGWLRFSALMRNIQYRDLVNDKNRNVTGWGI